MQNFKITNKLFYHWLILLFFLPLGNAFSNSIILQNDYEDYFGLDLEQLMELDVSIASVNPESIVETPAVVSRYNTKDLEEMGLRSLREILSFIPGVVIQSSNLPADSVMIRGISEAFNQKILLLIDDVPYWGASHSQIPLLGLPLEAIDHIEVIRGPGAVIYGTNASAGVIKVVSKSYSANNSLAIRTGSHNHFNGGGFYSNSIADSVDFSLGFEVQKEKGYLGFFKNNIKLDFLKDDQQTSGTLREKMEMKSLLAKLRIENLNIMMQTFNALETGSLGVAPTHPEKPGISEHDGYILHADYLWELDRTTIKAYTDYNMLNYKAYESNYEPGVERLVEFANGGRDNYRWRNGVTMNLHFSDELSFFVGSEFEQRAIGEYKMFINKRPVLTQLEKQNLNEISSFVQIDYQWDDFRFLVGARYTDNERSGTGLTPRASIIYSFASSQSIKLLYSEGFNSPNFLQTSVKLPFLEGNNTLKAEKVKTLDIAYTYSRKNTLFVLNAYRVEGKDFIVRIPRDTTTLTYNNSGTFSRQGLEFDLQYHKGKLKGFFNAAYMMEGNSYDKDDIEMFHIPKLTANIALNYHMDNHHSLGSCIRYVGPRSGINSYLTWNIDYQFKHKNFNVFASIRNLLSQAAFSRDMAGFSPEPVPVSDPKINFLLGIKYSF